jgi:hypothetical protein
VTAIDLLSSNLQIDLQSMQAFARLHALFVMKSGPPDPVR